MVLNIGIAGSGGIVRQCLKALNLMGEARCVALAVRESRMAEAGELARQYGIERVYADYAAMLADKSVQAVYVGIINSLHYDYARQALEAGKHVICEKPFTSTMAEAEELADTARKSGLYLFEAITMLHSPNYRELKNCLDRIGAPKMVQCNYSQFSSRYRAYLEGKVLASFDPSLSGGALYDINIYNLHFTVGLFGEPDRVRYSANLGFNGVDISGAVVLEYPNLVAVCCGAKDSDSPGYAMVQGEKGYVRINGAAYLTERLELKTASEHWERNFHQGGHYMAEELGDFARVVAQGDRASHDRWLEHSLAVMRVAEAARKDAGIVFGADGKK